MKISIVTVCRNSAATIGDTLQSVAEQTHTDVEHIIIDGVSTDGTLDLVREHGAHVAKLVSEKDCGIYDAMNKGVSLSSGAIVGFLNADDWYASPDALRNVVDAFAQGVDLVYGDLVFVSPEEPFSIRRVWRDANRSARRAVILGWHPAHPTTFVRRDLFDACGGFDLRWKIGADYAFLVKLLGRPGLRIRHVPRVLVNMRVGGASTSGVRAVWQANMECVAALRESGFAWPRLIVLMKIMRKLPQLVFSRRSAAEGPVWRPGVL